MFVTGAAMANPGGDLTEGDPDIPMKVEPGNPAGDEVLVAEESGRLPHSARGDWNLWTSRLLAEFVRVVQTL
jgi:hypothetical protein